jgi:hypothetical protein
MKGIKAIWTEELIDLLKSLYFEKTERELAEIIGLSRCAVKNQIKRLGLRLPADIYEARMKSTQWSKDHLGFRCPKGVHLSPGSEFKKGIVPKNTLYDGCIRVRNTHSIPYKWIRVSQGHWRELHKVIWEKKYGDVPEGMIIIFKNKDSMDVRIGNLKLITMAQNLKRNRPEDIHTNMEYRYRSDKWVSSYLIRDKKVRKEILKNHPEIIEIKRNQLILNRKIKETERCRNH